MSLPWEIKETTSKFDGSTTISIGRGGMESGLIGMSLYRNTKMQAGEIILVVAIGGAELFGTEPSLLIKIDGDVVELSSFDEQTKIKTSSGMLANGVLIPASNLSSKRYEVNRDFIHRLVTSKEVLIKLNLRDSYIEDDFSVGGRTSAKANFIKFLNRIDLDSSS